MNFKIIVEKLTYFRRDMYYKAETFFTSKNCTVFLFSSRSHISREAHIGRTLDLPADIKMTASCFFRRIALKINGSE